MKEALSSSEISVLTEPHGVTSQKTPFFIVPYSAVTLIYQSHPKSGLSVKISVFWNLIPCHQPLNFFCFKIVGLIGFKILAITTVDNRKINLVIIVSYSNKGLNGFVLAKYN
jgi:hypothetical protein